MVVGGGGGLVGGGWRQAGRRHGGGLVGGGRRQADRRQRGGYAITAPCNFCFFPPSGCACLLSTTTMR